MNTDKLISDTLNNRASTLDISQEKFEKMLEYIEVQGTIEKNSFLGNLKTNLKEIKTTFHMKQFLHASLFVLVIIIVPVILKNMGSFHMEKSSENSTSFKGEYSTEENVVSPSTGYTSEQPKSEEASPQGNSGAKPGSTEDKETVVILAPQAMANSALAYISLEEIEKVISKFQALGAQSIYINNILITDTTVIKKGDTMYFILIDDVKVSLTEPITVSDTR
jgi:hypothetical protein